MELTTSPHRSNKKTMKLLLSAVVLLLSVQLAVAQADTSSHSKIVRICVPSKGQLLSPPLYVIMQGDKIIYQDTTAAQKLSEINPDHIKAINVINGPAAITKYGAKAKYGVVEVQLKD